jgi:hypothetical protein
MLFVEDPSPRTTLILASFFFGNWVTIDVAAPFYALCIGRNHSQIHITMTILFLKWQRDFYTLHQTLYYDMTLGRFMYINGSACHEPREPLPFDLGDMFVPLGFAGLDGRTVAIEDRLRLVGKTSTVGHTQE